MFCGVPDRSAILIHGANWGGNKDKGFRTHLNGCIAPGRRVGRLEGQRAVLASQPALRNLIELEPEILEIQDGA